MITKTIIALMMIALPANLLAQTANEIIEKHTKDTAAALEEYLQKNPKASDSNDAINFLIESYSRLGMTERQAELLSDKYDKLPKGENLVPQEFFGVFQELFKLYLQSGSKDKAKIAIQNAKKDIVGHPQADRFGGFIDQLGGQLNTPAVGDVMDIKFVGLDGKETDLSKMKGKVTTSGSSPENQIVPQAQSKGIRPALAPLNGAEITKFLTTGENSYQLIYNLNNQEYTIDYLWDNTGHYFITFTDPDGASKTETYHR